jgi:hypothetical protein
MLGHEVHAGIASAFVREVHGVIASSAAYFYYLEAPICEGLLVRRVLQSFGISRAGSRIQLRNEELIRLMNLKTITHGDQKVYWKDSQVPDAYTEYRITGEAERKREAKDVPVQEAANAVCAVLELQIGLPRENLIRETAKLMGYSRLGNIVITTISDGIDYAIESGKIRSSTGDTLSLI